jgi:hypothetical protein
MGLDRGRVATTAFCSIQKEYIRNCRRFPPVNGSTAPGGQFTPLRKVIAVFGGKNRLSGKCYRVIFSSSGKAA